LLSRTIRRVTQPQVSGWPGRAGVSRHPQGRTLLSPESRAEWFPAFWEKGKWLGNDRGRWGLKDGPYGKARLKGAFGGVPERVVKKKRGGPEQIGPKGPSIDRESRRREGIPIHPPRESLGKRGSEHRRNLSFGGRTTIPYDESWNPYKSLLRRKTIFREKAPGEIQVISQNNKNEPTEWPRPFLAARSISREKKERAARKKRVHLNHYLKKRPKAFHRPSFSTKKSLERFLRIKQFPDKQSHSGTTGARDRSKHRVLGGFPFGGEETRPFPASHPPTLPGNRVSGESFPNLLPESNKG